MTARIQQMSSVDLASPLGTTVSVGIASVAAIAANFSRRGIIFLNPGLTVILYVCPSNLAAVIGQGVPIYPGAQVAFYGNADLIHFTSGWNAIAASGGANPLTILELV